MRGSWIRAWPLACALLAGAAAAAPVALVGDTDVRADKLPDAKVLRRLSASTMVDVLSVEGGWAWVAANGQPGWVRASALKLQAGQSAASLVPSGREKTNAAVGALAVRSLPVRGNRHALIIGISRYADPVIPNLPGARIDGESATQMATAMQVPAENIHRLRDEQATAAGIRAAIRELEGQVAEGDRVFIHFSGHGTRYLDTETGGCTEALLAYDGGVSGKMSNREVADLLAPLSKKTDKMLVVFDACYSGGVPAPDMPMRTRGILATGDEGRLRPKFSAVPDECARPSNMKTRSLVDAAGDKGMLPHDIVHVSSSREDEISFDDEQKGGLATQFLRDCMLRDAQDLDGSGAISIDEIRMCAQSKIEKRLERDPMFKPQNLVLSGNSAFVPAWFSAQQVAAVPVAVAATAPEPAPSPAPVAAQLAAPAASAPVAVAPPSAPLPPPPLTGAQALKQVFDQRDAKRNVKVSTGSGKLKIGEGLLDLSVTSARKGYVYVALAGSDNEAVYLLFPNELDTDNRIDAGRALKLPRGAWKVRAQGPAGQDHLLVLVTDKPRDLSQLGASRAGPFMKSLNDAQGRAALGSLLATDAFGAQMVSLEETP